MVSVFDSTERYLKTLPSDLADSPEAANALVMARAMDGGVGRCSISECSKRHLEALEKLRGLAPPKQEIDLVDELRERRTARRAKTADMPGS